MVEEVALSLGDLAVCNLFFQLGFLLRKSFINSDLSWLVAVDFVICILVLRFVVQHLGVFSGVNSDFELDVLEGVLFSDLGLFVENCFTSFEATAGVNPLI